MMMEKQIIEYIEFVDSELKKIDSDDKMRIDELSGVNHVMIENFRHERSIHLVVTLFFVFMTAVWFLLTIVFVLCEPFFTSVYMVTLLGLLTIIFIVIDVFYIRHYFFIENNIQQLYKYSLSIYRLKAMNAKE